MISKTPFIIYRREVAPLLANHDKFLLFINYSTKNQPIHPSPDKERDANDQTKEVKAPKLQK